MKTEAVVTKTKMNKQYIFFFQIILFVLNTFQWIFPWSNHLWNMFWYGVRLEHLISFNVYHIFILPKRWIFTLGNKKKIWWIWRELHLHNPVFFKNLIKNYHELAPAYFNISLSSQMLSCAHLHFNNLKIQSLYFITHSM